MQPKEGSGSARHSKTASQSGQRISCSCRYVRAHMAVIPILIPLIPIPAAPPTSCQDDEIVVLMQVPGQVDLYLVSMPLAPSLDFPVDAVQGYCEGVVGHFRGEAVRFHGRLKKPVLTKRQSVASFSAHARPHCRAASPYPFVMPPRLRSHLLAICPHRSSDRRPSLARYPLRSSSASPLPNSPLRPSSPVSRTQASLPFPSLRSRRPIPNAP